MVGACLPDNFWTLIHKFWEVERGVALCTILVTSFKCLLGLVVYVFLAT